MERAKRDALAEALDDDFNIIEIELKTPGTGEPINASLDPLKVDPGHYKLI